MTKMFIINQLKKTEATESFWSDILEIHKILQAKKLRFWDILLKYCYIYLAQNL